MNLGALTKGLARMGGLLVGRDAGAKSLAPALAQYRSRRRRTPRSRATRLDMAFGKKCRTSEERKRRDDVRRTNLRNIDLW